MDLKTFIGQMRDRKGFSFRELEKKAQDLNHAYIWRLEKGEQDAPSQETVDKLGVALELNEREQRIFQLLAKTPIDDALFRVMASRMDLPWECMESAAGMSYRGARPTTEEDWIKRIELIREMF
jgi:transcriptional regulator with XRE-family HTH domain